MKKHIERLLLVISICAAVAEGIMSGNPWAWACAVYGVIVFIQMESARILMDDITSILAILERVKVIK